jgi:hypothetical protein
MLRDTPSRQSFQLRFLFQGSNALSKLMLILTCTFMLAGCYSNTPQEIVITQTSEQPDPTPTSTATTTPSPTSSPTATETLIPPTSTPTPDPILLDPGYNPLTGKVVEDPSLLDRRPVMVKVSNWPREGRPHAGLSAADIVFEYYIGAYMNRFLAIYYGNNANVIGPVRSGRLVDAQLAQIYQGLLAYGDADIAVDQALVDVLGERALPFHIMPCPAMCGEVTHSATGVFANSAELTKYAVDQGIDNSRPSLQGMSFQEAPPAGDELGTIVSFVYADFSLTEWRYDPDTDKYLLWQDSEMDNGRITKSLTVDRNTGLPLSFDNIIIIFANYIQYTPSMHDIEVTYSSTYQSALFYRNGKMTYGTWHAADPVNPLIFQTLDGELMPLKPGQTWIILAGNHTVTDQVKPGEWDFYFNLP